jgi:hypothetical protein
MKRTLIVLGAAFLSASFAKTLAQDPKPARVKTAGEVFKNVQVLQDMPEDQWFGTMAFFAGSLGVTCDHCHTAEFAVDAGNVAKLKARQMIRMVNDINQNNFDGRAVVTCYTCHRGSLKPQAIAVPDMENWINAAEKDAPLPPAADLIRRYRSAVGTASARPVVSQSISLKMEVYSGKGLAKQSTVELLIGGPNRLRLTNRQGETTTTFIRNGSEAWARDSKGWRALDEDGLSTVVDHSANLDPDQVGPQPSIKTIGKDRVYGVSAYVVEADDKGTRKNFFFDVATGLLLRQRIFFPSFYADGSMDIEYADYKRVGDFQLPFTIRVINAGGEGLTIRRMTSRRLNVPVNAGAFAKSGE